MCAYMQQSKAHSSYVHVLAEAMQCQMLTGASDLKDLEVFLTRSSRREQGGKEGGQSLSEDHHPQTPEGSNDHVRRCRSNRTQIYRTHELTLAVVSPQKTGECVLALYWESWVLTELLSVHTALGGLGCSASNSPKKPQKHIKQTNKQKYCFYLTPFLNSQKLKQTGYYQLTFTHLLPK